LAAVLSFAKLGFLFANLAKEFGMQLDEILERQQRSWDDDDPISIENLLSEAPVLRKQSAAVVDLIYAEVLLREQRGEHPSKEDYVFRFPKLSDSIERQFQVHRVLGSSAEAEILTDPGGETLSENPRLRVAFASTPPSVPGFELEEMLGRGGSGVAWRARDINLNRTVAIKFLLDSDSDGDDPLNSDRLSREATAAANLLHPSIVQVHQVGETEGVPFLVMEYVDGGSLAQELRTGPLPAEKCVELATAIAQAVEHAHENGVIHRDIKPGNILLSRDGVPRVCDFGLARKLDAEHSLHETGDVLGTPAYMPPEQARGENADKRSDVYAIGAVLYQSLCGRSPFQAAHPWEILYQVTTIDPLPLRQLNPTIPVELETICQKCLEKNSDRRYQTAAELADDLKRYAEGKPIHARPIGTLGKFFKWCRRNRAVASLAGVSLLLLTTLAIGSTVAAVKLSASNKKILHQQQLATEAQHKAINDRTVAIDSLYELINSVSDKLISESLPLEAQENVALAAIVGLRKISAIDGDASSVSTAILAKQRIGEIQARRGYSDVAMIEFDEALEMARDFHAADPNDFDRKTTLAKVINYLLMHCNRVGESDKAQQLALESNLILDELLLEQPNNESILKRWVVARSYEMDVLWQTRPPQESIELGLQCLDNVNELYENTRDYDEGMRTVNQFYYRLGRAYMNALMPAEAEKYLKLANETIDEAIDSFPKNTALLSASAVTNKLYGLLLNSQGRFGEAKSILDDAVKNASFIAALDSGDLGNRAELANVRVNRSATLTAIGEHDLAIEDLEFGAAVHNEKLELAPGEISTLRALLSISNQMIAAYLRSHRFDDAAVAAKRVLEILDREDLPSVPGDDGLRWYSNLNIRVLNATEGKSQGELTSEDRAMGLFFIAFLFSAQESGNEFDDKSIDLIRIFAPESSCTTVTGMFEHVRSMPVTHPLVLSLMPLFETRVYARQAALLDGSNSKSESDKLRIEELKKQSIDLLVPLSKTSPTMITQIYLEPDLIWLRKTDAFVEAGLVLEGAD
jgi:serine/threonine protein kinase